MIFASRAPVWSKAQRGRRSPSIGIGWRAFPTIAVRACGVGIPAGNRIGVDAELLLLAQVSEGAYHLEEFRAGDIELAGGIVARYRELGIGLADASVVVIAARAGTNRIFTFDQRHFRAIRPLKGRSFKLLPGD